MSAQLINAGELNRLIALDRATQTEDAAGQPQRTWVEAAKVWARISTVKWQRTVVAGGINVELTHQLRIRFREGVMPDMRVRYAGRTFIVHVVDDVDTAHVALDLFCSEGTRED